jgi:AraC-like DNA-binding protein
MVYREARPSPHLAAWVDRYWMRSGHSGVTSRILPDGCADVIFDVDEGSGFVVGTMTSPFFVPAAPAPQLFGIRFRPGRALLGIGVPLAAITDTRAPLRDARSIAAGFAERVAAATSFDARIAAVEQMLSRALGRVTPDPVVDAAIVRIRRSARIETVAGAIGVSRQHLARRFAAAVGVSPKMFARIARFRRVLHSAPAAHADWTDVALSAGYFDQSHFIAEFREFAGMSPVPFFLSRNETTA